MKTFKFPFWLEHFFIFLLGQIIVATGAYLTTHAFNADTAMWGGIVSTGVKWLLDELRKIDPQAEVPSQTNQQ